jgi:hypothetical protein
MSLFGYWRHHNRCIGIGGLSKAVDNPRGKAIRNGSERKCDKASLNLPTLEETDNFSTSPASKSRTQMKVKEKRCSERKTKERTLVKKKIPTDSSDQSEQEIETGTKKSRKRPSKPKAKKNKTFKEEQPDLFSELFVEDSENESIHEETT